MKAFILTVLVMIGTVSLFARQSGTKFTSQNNNDFALTISDKNVQLVDVRTTAEYASGHIPGAANMDVQSRGFESNISQLDKTRPVALYCRSGARSKIAAKKFADKGFKVYELDKGISGWKGEITKKQIR